MTVKQNKFTSLQSGLSVLLCLLVALGGVQCYFVQFFQNTQYTGLLKDFKISHDGCIALGILETVRSIKTDRCLHVFNTPDCGGSGLSFRVEKDEPNLLSGFTHLQTFPIVRSFTSCGSMEGGVTVDFVDTKNGNRTSYQHVCGCRNIRHSNHWGKTKQISVDNNGNSMEFFSEAHCAGKSKVLLAGFSPESHTMWPGKDFDIKSFRSANHFNCLQLEASVSRINFQSDKSTEGGIGPYMESAQLATSANMRNYNAGKLTQEYSISEKVSKTLDCTLTKGLTKMNKLGFTTDFKTSAEVGVEGVAKGKIGFHTGINYFKSWTNSSTNSTKNIVTNEETVSTRQVIEVPSCKECEATSSLQKVKGYPIPYTAYARVNGSDSEGRLGTKDLRANLPTGLDYVKDYDEYTVEVESKGVVLADFALYAFIGVDCVPIPGCKASR